MALNGWDFQGAARYRLALERVESGRVHALPFPVIVRNSIARSTGKVRRTSQVISVLIFGARVTLKNGIGAPLIGQKNYLFFAQNAGDFPK